MDKRSLLSILCISFAFFGIQTWFSSQRDSELLARLEAQKQQSSYVVQSDLSLQPSSDADMSEKFYVLENDYQQLVFSTKGGALVEINLPFVSKSPNSLVNPIEADRILDQTSPLNSKFPLHSAYRIDKKGSARLEEGVTGGYYPLLRRPQIQLNKSESFHPEFYAFNIVGDDPKIAQLPYKVTQFTRDSIQFEYVSSQRRIVKTFQIPAERNGPYCFEASIQIDGNSKGLWLTSGVPEVELISGSSTPVLRYQNLMGRSSDVETIQLTNKIPKIENSLISPNWISNSNGFLGIILDPLDKIGSGYRAEKIQGSLVPTRLSLIDAEYHLYPPEKYPGFATFLPLLSDQPQRFRIFAGPFDHTLLKELDQLYDNPLTGYNPDYTSAQNIQGWFSFISQPFTKFLQFMLGLFYGMTHSWGLSIILLTVFVRLMMHPLNSWSTRSSIAMQQLAPKINVLKERFKNDPKKCQIETMKLYRENGVNPFGGCLPLFIQMPFLVGMFYLLKSTFPLRGASFIPGWINNLAAPDVLFQWDYPLPLIGNQFHLLPFILGASIFIQQKISAAPTASSPDMQNQQKMIMNTMLVFFTVLFYSLPSGLNIYYLFNTILGIAQQYFMKKKLAIHSQSQPALKK